MTAGNGADADEFGSDVAISIGRVLVGSVSGDNAGGANSGSAYVFEARTPDCNANNVLDACDIANGNSQDCNLNAIPDECDISTGTSLDCNANTVPDDCDIRDGTSQDCNTNAVPDECDISDGTSQDCNANTVPDDCECLNTLAPAPEAGSLSKNRYISFVPNNSCVHAAIRVTLTVLPAPFEGFAGRQMWVGPPHAVSEGATVPGPGNPPRFSAAELQCSPHYTQWDAWGTLSVSAAEIVPGAQYTVQVIEAGCETNNEGSYSPPLSVPTGLWGDVIAPAQRNFADISAVVGKFQDKPAAVGKSRADLAPNIPDRIVNFSDISVCVNAFMGLAYPYAGPATCP